MPARDRTQALGWLTVATNIGVTLGAAAGSLSRNLGPHAPGFLAATLCFVNIAVGFFWLSEPPAHEEPAGAPAPAARRSVRRSIFEVLRHPLAPVSSLVWIYAVGMMAFFAMNSIFGLYLGDLFGVTENTIGYFFVYIGGLNVAVRAFLLGPAVRRFGEVGALRLGALTLVAGLLILPAMQSLPLLALAVVLRAGGHRAPLPRDHGARLAPGAPARGGPGARRPAVLRRRLADGGPADGRPRRPARPALPLLDRRDADARRLGPHPPGARGARAEAGRPRRRWPRSRRARHPKGRKPSSRLSRPSAAAALCWRNHKTAQGVTQCLHAARPPSPPYSSPAPSWRLSVPPPARVEVLIRQTAPVFGAASRLVPEKGEWQVSLSYRDLDSDTHYSGSEHQRVREREQTFVVNTQQALDIGVSYAATERLSFTLGIPLVRASWAVPTPIRPVPGPREKQEAEVVGDVSLTGRYWLFAPETRHVCWGSASRCRPASTT